MRWGVGDRGRSNSAGQQYKGFVFYNEGVKYWNWSLTGIIDLLSKEQDQETQVLA